MGETKPGIREAVMQMRAGDHFIFEIPAKKYFGNKGKVDERENTYMVGPDSDVIYEVEIINIL